MTDNDYFPGKLKIMAKIQHFYDYLIDSSARAGEIAIMGNDYAERRMEHGIVMEAYTAMAIEYKDVFGDFIYTGDEDDE